MLQAGDTAPSFELPDHRGETVSLETLLANGRILVYFYPADFSPVCTAQACAFRDVYDGVDDLGVQVVGISPQSVESHARFVERYKLPFPLLSDTRKTTIRAWGVDGPFGIGVRRATFLIEPDRKVARRVLADFSATSHVDLLREALG